MGSKSKLYNPRRQSMRRVAIFATLVAVPALYVAYSHFSGPGECPAPLQATSWNIAAVNNNPFEYWVTHTDKAYNKLMADVQTYIDEIPAGSDVPVSQIITDDMFKELKDELLQAGVAEDDVAQVETRWNSEYKDRKAITEFIKDPLIGKKRLASMPDRVTNTINTAGGGTALRPTPVNCFDGEMGTVATWWPEWKKYMFHNEITTVGGTPKRVYSLLVPIQSDKYPALSKEEEDISLPLQTLALAIFDSILVHMLSSVGKDTWQPLRKSLCDSLNKHKDDNIVRILNDKYGTSDIIFLQETSAAFMNKAAKGDLSGKYAVIKPSEVDGKRDQNSIILVDKYKFDLGSIVDITEKVLSHVNGSNIAAPGDVFAVSIRYGSDRFMLASFHGDTNGLATKPIVGGVQSAASSLYSDHILLMGLDGNTYKQHDEHYQGVLDFDNFLHTLGMSSCWVPHPDPLRPTTCNARTYLQPQLNKAVRSQDKLTEGDVNLKDWIVFYASQMVAADTTRDNTGDVSYTEEMVFPTLNFPSDHAVISTHLTPTVGAWVSEACK